MLVYDQHIENCYLFDSDVYSDSRGYFYRSFCQKLTNADVSTPFIPLQGNISVNPFKGTLRGMHMQRYPSSESKLITCVTGSVYLVVIDLRSHSPTFCIKRV